MGYQLRVKNRFRLTLNRLGDRCGLSASRIPVFAVGFG